MSLLFVEAFGNLRQDENQANDEEDLYSVFRARSELMGWSTTLQQESLLWNMNEADLTAGDNTSRIGRVQVDLQNVSVRLQSEPSQSVQAPGFRPLGILQDFEDPSAVLPALIQCFYDALQRFGKLELSGFQVTIQLFEPMSRSHLGTLVSSLNWFNAIQGGNEKAIITFRGVTADDLVARLHQIITGPFRFTRIGDLSEGYRAEAGIDASSPNTVLVHMPEWSASAAAWVLALCVDTVCIGKSYSDFVVRIMRV